MNDFLPIYCPICSLKLRKSNALKDEHLLVCDLDPNAGCVFISYDNDWQFKDMSFYVGRFLLICVRPDYLILVQDGAGRDIPFAFPYDEMLDTTRLTTFLRSAIPFL